VHPSGNWENDVGLTPLDSLANAQYFDGGVRDTSESKSARVWSTSYAVTAASGKNWMDLLQSFAKPVASRLPSGDDSSGGASFSSTATTSSSTQSTPKPQVLGTSTNAEPIELQLEPEVPTVPHTQHTQKIQSANLGEIASSSTSHMESTERSVTEEATTTKPTQQVATDTNSTRHNSHKNWSVFVAFSVLLFLLLIHVAVRNRL